MFTTFAASLFHNEAVVLNLLCILAVGVVCLLREIDIDL